MVLVILMGYGRSIDIVGEVPVGYGRNVVVVLVILVGYGRNVDVVLVVLVDGSPYRDDHGVAVACIVVIVNGQLEFQSSGRPRGGEG